MSEEQENPQGNKSTDAQNGDFTTSGSENVIPVTPPSFQQNPGFNPFGGPQNLPNSTVTLILGILSIPACCCYGLGLIFGIVAWVLGAADIKKYNLSPALYSISSYKNTKAGKTCGIVGAILSLLYLICIIGVIAFFGWAALKDPEVMKELLREKGIQ